MGLFLQKKLKNGANISIWKIEETEEELKNLSSIPNLELEEISLIKGEARRKEKFAVRALLAEVYGDKVYLGYHDNGRPFLQNSIVELSISHTNKFAAILTHPEDSVGVDIESLARDFSAVEKKALSASEIADLSDKNRSKQLAVYWSAKEAIYKLMSQSSVDFSTQIIINRFTLKDTGDISATFIDKDGYKRDLELEYEFFEDHVLVWVIN